MVDHFVVIYITKVYVYISGYNNVNIGYFQIYITKILYCIGICTTLVIILFFVSNWSNIYVVSMASNIS